MGLSNSWSLYYHPSVIPTNFTLWLKYMDLDEAWKAFQAQTVALSLDVDKRWVACLLTLQNVLFRVHVKIQKWCPLFHLFSCKINLIFCQVCWVLLDLSFPHVQILKFEALWMTYRQDTIIPKWTIPKSVFSRSQLPSWIMPRTHK